MITNEIPIPNYSVSFSSECNFGKVCAVDQIQTVVGFEGTGNRVRNSHKMSRSGSYSLRLVTLSMYIQIFALPDFEPLHKGISLDVRHTDHKSFESWSRTPPLETDYAPVRI